MFEVSDQDLHRQGCTDIEDGLRLKFRIHEAECLYYLYSEMKGDVQLCDYRSIDRDLCFHIRKKRILSFKFGFNSHS